MVKIKEIEYTDSMILHEHYCPACDHLHQIAVKQPFRNGAQWTFNNDFEKPTFSPSIKIAASTPEARCHYFIKKGMIEYCGDSFHEYKGKTIELPDIPSDLI